VQVKKLKQIDGMVKEFEDVIKGVREENEKSK